MANQVNRPCAQCPFRKDVPAYLTQGRAEEIVTGLQRGAMFPCHETTNVLRTNARKRDERWCAGAALTMDNEGTLGANQMARICGRLGMLNPDTMRGAELCSRSLRTWAARFRKRETVKRGPR